LWKLDQNRTLKGKVNRDAGIGIQVKSFKYISNDNLVKGWINKWCAG